MKTITWLLLLPVLLCGLPGCRQTPEPTPATVPVIDGNTEVRFEDYETMILASSVSANGGSPILRYGHLYSVTDPDPKKGTSGGTAVTGIPNATYTSRITNYSLNKTMYVRAFADNEAGTGYGKVVQVKTPSVTYKLRVTIKTGQDNKRSESYLNANLVYNDGKGEAFAIASGVGLDGYSTRIEQPVSAVKSNVRRGQIQGIELYWLGISTTYGHTYDNWDLDALKVELIDSAGGKTWTLYDKSGGVFRFTADQQNNYFAF